MRDSIKTAIRDHVGEIPPHIRAIARSVTYDLMHGPSYLLIPAGDVTRVDADCLATFREDLECEADPSDVIAETYTSPAADALRAWCEDLPSTLYVDEDGFCSDCEPEYREDEESGDMVEPVSYCEVDRRDILAAIFGTTFAREFR